MVLKAFEIKKAEKKQEEKRIRIDSVVEPV